MKLQKATRFALYAVLELAAAPERQMSAGEIAEKYGISVNHLAKVLRDLSRSGLIESVRGVGGGYRFAGNAKRVTLMDIIAQFEDISSMADDRSDTGRQTDVSETLHLVLAEIEDIARATLQSVTIDTLLKQSQRRRRKAVADQALARVAG